MKPILASCSLALAVSAMAFAQDTTGDRVVVPARNTSHARVVNCKLLNGSITVKTYDGKEVIVESAPGRNRRPTPPPPDGMKRIGMSDRGLEVEEIDNVISVRDRPGNRNLLITVPVDTSLRLSTLSGAVTVGGVHGEVEAHSLNGQVVLNNISGTVTADTQNGQIKVTMDAVDRSKPIALSTLNGQVDITLPQDVKLNLTIKSSHGQVFSDFDVTLGGRTGLSEKNGSPDGMFRIRIDNTIHGTINGGGPELTIRTLNGGVYLRKKK